LISNLIINWKCLRSQDLCWIRIKLNVKSISILEIKRWQTYHIKNIWLKCNLKFIHWT
jgi:hypothetical protein